MNRKQRFYKNYYDAGTVLIKRLSHIPFGEFSRSSSSVSYYLILSVVPFFVLIAGFTTLLGQSFDPSSSLRSFKDIIPAQVYEVIIREINRVFRTNPFSVLSIGALSMIWTSSSGFTSLLNGLTTIYKSQSFSIENNSTFPSGALAKLTKIGIGHRLMGLLLSLLLILGFLLSFVLNGVGKLLMDLFLSQFPRYDFLASSLYSITLLLPFFYMWLIITMIYRMAVITAGNPHCKKGIFFYSFFPAVAWVIISLGLSRYLNNIGQYSIVYGSLGGIAIFLVWIYACCYALMAGAFFHSRCCQRSCVKKEKSFL